MKFKKDQENQVFLENLYLKKQVEDLTEKNHVLCAKWQRAELWRTLKDDDKMKSLRNEIQELQRAETDSALLIDEFESLVSSLVSTLNLIKLKCNNIEIENEIISLKKTFSDSELSNFLNSL